MTTNKYLSIVNKSLITMAFGLMTLGNTPVYASQYDTELLQLTNAQRQSMGLTPLCLSSQLGQAAQFHAQDMADNNYFSHTGLDGSQVWDRAGWFGYTYYRISENIALGYNNPSAVMDGWMNSPGHRANLLDSEVTEIGFGYAYSYSGDYGHYWVQVFGNPANGSTCSTNDNNSGYSPDLTDWWQPENSYKTQVDALFGAIEDYYPEYFPSGIQTAEIEGDSGTGYYRAYPYYDAILFVYDGYLAYSFFGEWFTFGTFDEAYQVFLGEVPSNPDDSNSTDNSNSGERIQKTNDTFIDTQTGLEWVASGLETLERDEAISYCNSLNYAGYQDWRLSTNSELSTFVKALAQSSVKPGYFGSFDGCTAGITTDGYTALTTDYVSFGEPLNFMGHASVRCVR